MYIYVYVLHIYIYVYIYIHTHIHKHAIYIYIFSINLEPLALGTSEKTDRAIVDHCSPITCMQLHLAAPSFACVA